MKVIEVTAAILWKEGQVLIGERPIEDGLAHKWEFPGGKIEEGETPEECLKREIQEELGIIVEVKDFFAESVYAYPKGAIRLLAYFTRWETGDLSPMAHKEIKWVDIHELLNYDLAPADIPIAQKLVSRALKSRGSVRGFI